MRRRQIVALAAKAGPPLPLPPVAPQPIHRTRILDALAEAQGPVSLWNLVDLISPGSDDDSHLRAYISLLRKRLGRDAIETVRGVGYRLTDAGRAKIQTTVSA